MGCVKSKEGGGSQTQNDHVEDTNILKVLCLGVGGCGKTTFIKQMRTIHNVPWLDIELDNFAKIIRSNLVTGVQECVQILTQGKGKEKLSEENEEEAKKLLELSRTTDLTEDNEAKELLCKIFNDPAVKAVATTQADKLQFSSFASYFDDIDNICSKDFKPNDEQILRCRQRTVGSNATRIRMDEATFEFHDVGGQRPERTKWAKSMEDNIFTLILYFVALDQWDTMSDGTLPSEYDNKTKLECSKDIFAEVLDYNETRNIPIVVFLNRKDLFEVRLETKQGWQDFKGSYPKYKGKQNNLEDAMEHIRVIFLEEAKEKYGVQPVCHFTCNLDSKAMEVVWGSIKNELLTKMAQGE